MESIVSKMTALTVELFVLYFALYVCLTLEYSDGVEKSRFLLHGALVCMLPPALKAT